MKIKNMKIKNMKFKNMKEYFSNMKRVFLKQVFYGVT